MPATDRHELKSKALLAIALFALVTGVCAADTGTAVASVAHEDCSLQAATGATSSPAPAPPHPVAVISSIVAPVLPPLPPGYRDVESGALADWLSTAAASPRSPPRG